MWRDPVVEEVRKLRDQYARQFDYDLKRIFQDLREQERADGREVVTLKPRRAFRSRTVS